MVPPVTWNERRRGWIKGKPTPAPVPIESRPADPPIVRPIVILVPAFPCFSPASVAALLGKGRSSVSYWMAEGRLVFFRDNIGDPYILREELVRFIRDYLKLSCQ